METLRQDFRYAFRKLLKSPGFTLVAVLTLALGIGANSAIFSVVHGVLLRSLPFAEADRLINVYTAYPNDETKYPLSAPDFMSVREGNRVFTDVVAFDQGTVTLTGTGEPRQFQGTWVSDGFFSLLGISPVAGRVFTRDENQPDNTAVVLLSDRLWRQSFGGDPDVVGRPLTLNGVTRVVIGVLPAGFDFPGESDFFIPLRYDERFDAKTAYERRGEWLGVIARMKPGVTVAQAQAEVATIGQRLKVEFPETNVNMSLASLPLHELVVGSVRTPLIVLLISVGLVLLIACANVANLLLARAAGREAELALRTALGAGRGRLLGQLLTESLVLGAIGGVVGLGLAIWGTDALVAARPENIPRLDEVGVSGTVVAFTAGIALLTSIVFGLFPALQATRGNLVGALKEGGRGPLSGRSGNRLRAGLVVAETALAVVLLVGAGLLIRSFLHLTAVEPGFQPEHAVSFDVALPSASYDSREKRSAFVEQLTERLAMLPGVAVVGASNGLPLRGSPWVISFSIPGRAPLPRGQVQDIHTKAITPNYFRAIGTPLVAGRMFAPADRLDAPPVALINEAAVRKWFPNEDPIGKRLQIDVGDGAEREIVGVVGDVRQFDLSRAAEAEAFIPHAQLPTGFVQMVVRANGDPLALTNAIRREVRALDANLPVQAFTTLEQLVSESVAQPRFYSLLLGLFSLIALGLAAVGMSGVIAFVVSQRTREIGVRMALGARSGDVVRAIVGRAMLLALGGIAIGTAAAVGFTGILQTQLFGVGRIDPLTFLGVAAVLTAVALAASYVPARRATRVDPLVALRHE